MSSRYVSAVTRLQRMPAWFHRQTAARMMEMPLNTTKTYLNRWVKAGLLSSMGHRTGVYLNRIVEPKTSQASWAAALVSLYPEAIVMGDSILHASGLTTQIPPRLHIAVLRQRTHKQVDRVTIHPRPKSWFAAVHGHLIPPEHGELGADIRELPPTFALADLVIRNEAPAADDLDTDAVDREEFASACLVIDPTVLVEQVHGDFTLTETD